MTQLVLITGLSGSGKSALSRHLTARGERAISLDGHPGLCRWEDSAGQPVQRPAHPDLSWLQRAWNWQLAVLDKLVAAGRKAGHARVFLCGMAVNQDLFLDRFGLVLMLDIDLDTMLARLDNASRGNDFVSALGLSDCGVRIAYGRVRGDVRLRAARSSSSGTARRRRSTSRGR